MLTFSTIAALGAYLSRRIDSAHDSNSADFSINYRQIWQDAISFFTLIGFIMGWTIKAAQSARNYFDKALVPWFSKRGIHMSIPSFDLPKMPDPISGNLDELVEQDL